MALAGAAWYRKGIAKGGRVKLEFKKAALVSLSPDPAKESTYWDTQVPTLCLRVFPSGVKTFAVKYRLNGRQSFIKLGRLGELTIEDARRKALAVRQEVTDGIDPAKAKARGMTVTEAARRMMDERGPKLRPKTISNYQQIINTRIIPRLGNLPIAALTVSDIAAFHTRASGTPRQTNISLSVLSIICKQAEKWGERPLGSNPCQHQEKYPEQARHRYLSDTEITAIGEALDRLHGRHSEAAIDALRLIMLTGARKGEILNLRWEQVDLEGRTLRFEPSEHKTGGATRAKQIPVGEAAIELLKARQGEGGYVFQGQFGGPLEDIKRLWNAVRVEANVPDVNIHDLRHTWGAVATSGGHALQTIGAVMGHRNPSTTARYAHVAPSPAARAVEETSAKIAAAMGGKKKNKR